MGLECGAKHSPLFLHLWWPSGEELLGLRVFGEMHAFPLNLHLNHQWHESCQELPFQIMINPTQKWYQMSKLTSTCLSTKVKCWNFRCPRNCDFPWFLTISELPGMFFHTFRRAAAQSKWSDRRVSSAGRFACACCAEIWFPFRFAFESWLFICGWAVAGIAALPSVTLLWCCVP